MGRRWKGRACCAVTRVASRVGGTECSAVNIHQYQSTREGFGGGLTNIPPQLRRDRTSPSFPCFSDILEVQNGHQLDYMRLATATEEARLPKRAARGLRMTFGPSAGLFLLLWPRLPPFRAPSLSLPPLPISPPASRSFLIYTTAVDRPAAHIPVPVRAPSPPRPRLAA